MTEDEGPVARADHAMTAGSGLTEERLPEPEGLPPRQRPLTPLAAMLVLAGALVAGAVSGDVLSGPPSFEVSQVQAADLDAAAQSIPPAEAGTHIADAKACKVPMAFVTLRPHPGQSGTVRIRSGDYWSPTIRLGNDPLRIAIPYPAPYEVARGDLAFESGGADYDVFLRPGWFSASRQGVNIVHVWWTPKSPC